MHNMNYAQYEKTLSEQFMLGSVLVTVAMIMPGRWAAYDETNKILLCKDQPTKAMVIEIAERIVGKKRDMSTIKYL